MSSLFYFCMYYFFNMPKKILKFDFTSEIDFAIIAVVCSLKDYRLCFELNTALKLNLKREKDKEFLDRNHNRSLFTSFFYKSKDQEEIRVVVNKGTVFSFIPEKKNIDYFMTIKHMSAVSQENFIEQVKNISSISGVYELEHAELKSAENFLVFD